MPVIRGETRRGLRLLPGVRAEQAMLLGQAAAVGGAEWHLPWSVPARVVLLATTGISGGAAAFWRWPRGPEGETLTAWLPRWLRYLVRPRRLVGPRVAGWDGVEAIGVGGELTTGSGRAVVMECTGPGGTLLNAPCQGAWRQLLHGVRAPLQVVTECRWPDETDRPLRWRAPAAAGTGPANLRAAYANHWTELLASRRLVVRQSFLVLTAGPGPDVAARLEADRSVAVAALAALNVTPRALRGPEVVALLHRMAGAAAASGPLPAIGRWSVRKGV